MPSLRKTYPGLRLYLHEDQSARLIEGLSRGELDLLLLAFPYPTGRLETRLFAEDPFWAAFPRGHGFELHEQIKPEALAKEELLLLGEGHCLRDHALAACATAGDGEAAAFEGSSLHTLALMVDNGLGLTLFPKMAIDAGILRGTRLRTRPLDGASSRQIGLAWRPASPRTGDFELLAEILGGELATPLPPRSRIAR